MKERKTYRKLFLFKLTECDALKEYLEEMALKGWMLKDIKTYLTFEKAEPQRIIYSVEVFDKASIFDSRLEDKALVYVDYCAKAGWDFVSTAGKILVFRTTNENAAPIETDERQKFKTIIKGTIYQNFVLWFILPAIMTFNLYMSSLNFERFITTNIYLFNLVAYSIFITLIISQIISFLIWIQKSRSQLKIEGRIFSYSKNDLMRRNRIRLIPIGIILLLTSIFAFVSFVNGDISSGLLMILTILMVAGILVFSVWLQKRSLSRDLNIVIPIAAGTIIPVIFLIIIFFIMPFSPSENSNSKEIVIKEGNSFHWYTINNDKIPVTLEDFGIKAKKYRNKSKSTDRSVFAAITNYSDSTFKVFSRDGDDPEPSIEIDYDIFDSRFSFIIERYLEQKLDLANEAGSILKEESKKFNAKKIYTEEKSRIIIVYDTRVITFDSFDIKLNDNQIRIICDKLAPDSAKQIV